jgi:predicted nucleic acid-binding protein
MPPKPNPLPRSVLVGVDTNVAFDLADGHEDTVDAIDTIRSRLSSATLCVLPTVAAELAHAATNDRDHAKAKAALGFLRSHQSLGFRIVNFVPVGHGIVERIASHLRHRGLIPTQEVNDSLILAEAALLGCRVLLTRDQHLRGIEFDRLSLELASFDVPAPIIAPPREIVRRFFR